MPICSNCGEENPDRAKFCLNCGASLEAAPTPGRERKFVTILFADVTGSTGLGERLDPERLKDVMSAYFDAMRGEIEAEGGTVEKFIGDAVMAAFGVPQAHEDDPARALRAALRMRSRLAALNQDLDRRFGVTLQARIGVNSGEVLASTAPRPDEGMVTGDAVNVAARLEQAAEPGQVLVAERTAKATRGFLFDEAVPLELKGKDASVSAMRLLGSEEAPERGVPGLRAPMVGRDQELTVLSALFDRVRKERHPHLVTIYGDPGVGKSRLTAEFLASVSDGAQVIRGRCLPYGEGVTYWPLAEILKGHSGVLDSDPPDVALTKIRETGAQTITSDLATDPARATAALAYTVGLTDPAFGFDHLPPRQVRVETHEAWRSYLSALAQAQPTVVVIEDIHWADPALLDLLEELAERSQGPLLFVCPARPELTQNRPTWGGGKRNFSSIFLEPLSPEDADRLVGFLLAVEDMPASLHNAILERAEGNPFFLEEILRQLIDEGRIVRSGDRWRAGAELEQVVIPDTVQGVLAARIDLLGPDEKRTLQSAAVVGRVFWTGPVERLLNGQAERLDEILGRLQDRELVLSRLGSSMAGDREFAFKHALIRDVAYESLPRRDRTAAHVQVARWIEETAADRKGEFVELLAYHYAEAYRGAEADPAVLADERESVRERALGYLLDGAREARTRLALDAARRLGDRAFALAAQPLERARAQESLGATALTEYRGDDAWELFKAAADERLANVPEDRVAIARVCGRALEVPTRWPGSMSRVPPEPEVRPYLEAGLAHLDEADGEERARLLIGRSFWPWAFPEVQDEASLQQAIDAGNQAAEMALRMGRPDLASAALDGVGSTYGMQGLDGQMAAIAERRMGIARELEDPFELGDIHAVAAWWRVQLGHYREATEKAVEGIRRSANNPGTTLHCVVWLGLARYRLGEWAAVLEQVRVAEAMLGERADDPPGFALRLFATAAFVHEAQGDRGMADRRIGSLNRVHRGGNLMEGSVAPWLAPALARRGSTDEAMAWLEHVAAAPFRVHLALVLEAWCDLVAEAQDWEKAPEVLARTREQIERGASLALPLFADRLEGRAALAAGYAERGIELLRSAREGFAGLEARWEAAVTDLSLAEALLQAEGRDQAAKLLPGALTVFDELKSVRELQRTRELLTKLR